MYDEQAQYDDIQNGWYFSLPVVGSTKALPKYFNSNIFPTFFC